LKQIRNSKSLINNTIAAVTHHFENLKFWPFDIVSDLEIWSLNLKSYSFLYWSRYGLTSAEVSATAEAIAKFAV